VGQIAESVEFYKKAHDLTSSMGNKLDIVINSNRLASCLLKLGKPDEAMFYAKRGLTFSKSIKALNYIRDSYFILADVHAALLDFDSAYFNHKSGQTLADSITRKEAELQNAQLQFEFELDQKDEYIRLLNQEKELNQAQIRNRDNLVLGSILVVGLSSLLAFSTFLRFRQKNRANKKLQQQNHQIELLLSEVHHRVKNNLQVISSLLSIQMDQLKDENARMAVLEGQSRVQAMGFIHETIYRNENFTFIDMQDYIQRVSASLQQSFAIGDRIVKVEIETERISLDVETAIPLGLILNELITNCLKHAFGSADNPLIRVHLRLSTDRALLLTVQDNGSGMVLTENQDSFGLRLVRELTDQLKGTVAFVSGDGTTVLMTFRKFSWHRDE
jgi:two-component sensor histidine kinase